MENQHPEDAAPELAEAVTPEAVAEQGAETAPGTQPEGEASPSAPVSDEPAEEEAGAKSKAAHPRTIVARLAEVYPEAFATDGRKVRPLAVGILKELQAAREAQGEDKPGHGLSMQELRRALRYYTQGAAYHRAIARGDARVNLAGEAVAEVTEEQKAHAEAKLVELAPKLPKRPERPARKAAEGESGGGQGGEGERPRRPRTPSAHGRRPSGSPEGESVKPSGPRGEGRGPARGEGRGPSRGEGKGKPRREGAPRPPRAERPARQDEPAAPVLSSEEKLNLLLEKFGGK
ncbi:MAG: ProQ/FINO family protein [Pseudomonadota bacterium]